MFVTRVFSVFLATDLWDHFAIFSCLWLGTFCWEQAEWGGVRTYPALPARVQTVPEKWGFLLSLSEQSITSSFGNALKVAPPWQRRISMEPGEVQPSLHWIDHSLCLPVNMEANSRAPFASKKILASSKECNSPTHHWVMHGFPCEASHSRSQSAFYMSPGVNKALKAVLHTPVLAVQVQSPGQSSRCPSPATNTLNYLNTFSTVLQRYEGPKCAFFWYQNVSVYLFLPPLLMEIRRKYEHSFSEKTNWPFDCYESLYTMIWAKRAGISPVKHIFP